jgi:hypothetical protein
MLAALQPALDAVALKFELGLKELKADLGEIVILRDHITAKDTKIASLQARLRAPPRIIDNNVIPWDIPSPQNLPPPPGLRVHLKAPGNIPLLPPFPAATQPLHSIWTTVLGKRKVTIKAAPTPEQAAKIAKPSPVKPGPFTYPRTEREVVIEFENLLRLPTTPTSNSVRNAVNKMLIDRKDVTVPPFVNARFSRNNNLVLITPPAKNNIEYEPYLGLICEALTPLGKGIPHINEKWTKFVIHGVPTRAKIPTIQTEFQLTYDKLTLVQTPRWLTPQEKRESTESGLMVLAFAGSVNLIDFIGTNYLGLEANYASRQFITNSVMQLDVQIVNYMAILQRFAEKSPQHAQFAHKIILYVYTLAKFHLVNVDQLVPIHL